MKTLLSQFCEEFDGVVRPLMQPLTQAADTLNQASDRAGLRTILPTVLDVRHHLSTLANKVAEQQAYVIIFGPLKSGKSTLMNGISAAYVSEVTTLPAYPCMVYVSHGDKVGFKVTRYNGSTEEFDDMDSMRTLLEFAHTELADRIREVEARNETFDPNVHIPTAIRRVDVAVPARDLADSSAVLVDTPGLYSRMKFGYDRMTKEFRNSASCAIFVVKTDNLFLEQVFDEFSELLKLFSRIFLVVNVDSTKRDLLADGQLGPSLEGKNPDRIVTAFRNLSMSAPLKKAAEEGRLRIYPIDLLRAASSRVKGEAKGDGDTPAAFKVFQKDLTDYLNSTDYLVAFLGDSLRQARGLLGELKGACDQDAVKELAEQVQALEQEKVQLEGRAAAALRLGECSWDSSFGALGDDLAAIASGRVEKLRDQTTRGLATALDGWFEGDASFQSLLDDYMRPLLDKSRQDLTETARGVLETVAATDMAGASVSDEVGRDLTTLDLNLGRLGRESLSNLDPGQALAKTPLAVSTDGIPVKKGFFDYIFFRSQVSVRRRLFGPLDKPTNPVPRQTKVRKLGEPGRGALQDALEDAFDAFFDRALEHLSTQVLQIYVGELRRRIKSELKKLQDADDLRRTTVERRLDELKRVSVALGRLSRGVESATTSLASLSQRYGKTDPEKLREPVEEKGAATRAGGTPGVTVRPSKTAAGPSAG